MLYLVNFLSIGDFPCIFCFPHVLSPATHTGRGQVRSVGELNHLSQVGRGRKDFVWKLKGQQSYGNLRGPLGGSCHNLNPYNGYINHINPNLEDHAIYVVSS